MTNNEIIKFLQSKQIPQCGDKEYTADEEYEAYQRAIDAIEQTRWITVSERLPEENRTVIASTEYGVCPEARYTEEDGWQWAYESGADYWVGLKNVTAWQPLPEPYKCNNSERYLNYADQDTLMPAT